MPQFLMIITLVLVAFGGWITVSSSYAGSETMSEKTAEFSTDHLSNMQKQVTMHDGTEPPFKNKYWDHKEDGIYVDVISGEALFSSTDKFESGTGWPSFTRPIKESVTQYKSDQKLFMTRTEVRSEGSDAHLGHVFNDGPPEAGGQRYCINSAALDFIALAEMEDKGYGEYLVLFDDAQ
jgi:peptide-methionine (R)-S-oxide reductase